MCYNFFESLYSVAHFKCKGCILYSKLLLQWAVGKKKFSRVPSLKKLCLEIFKYHIEKKIRVDYFRSKKAKEKCFVEKKIWTVNLPWNDPYIIVYYVPRRIMRVITRRATMLAGDRSRGAITPASILSESRNYPNCVHWSIFYFMFLRRIYELSWSLKRSKLPWLSPISLDISRILPDILIFSIV